MMEMEADSVYRNQRYRGLLHRAWRVSGVAILGFTYLWVLCLWTLQLFTHPGFLLAFGILYSLVVGFALGLGSLTGEGDEMLFCLPVTRSSLFWIQAAAGGIPLLLMNGLGVLALYGEAPQHLWGLWVLSGFTESFPEVQSPWLWGWAICVPVLLYASLYSLSSKQTALRQSILSAVGAVLLTGGTLYLAAMLEQVLWKELYGALSSLCLLSITAGILWWGAETYRTKEASLNDTPAGPNSKSFLLLILVGTLLLVLTLAMFAWAKSPDAPVPQQPDPVPSILPLATGDQP